jgi:hypothetical protein
LDRPAGRFLPWRLQKIDYGNKWQWGKNFDADRKGGRATAGDDCDSRGGVQGSIATCPAQKKAHADSVDFRDPQ